MAFFRNINYLGRFVSSIILPLCGSIELSQRCSPVSLKVNGKYRRNLLVYSFCKQVLLECPSSPQFPQTYDLMLVFEILCNVVLLTSQESSIMPSIQSCADYVREYKVQRSLTRLFPVSTPSADNSPTDPCFSINSCTCSTTR